MKRFNVVFAFVCVLFVMDFMKDDGTVTAEGDMKMTQAQFQDMYGERLVTPGPISKRLASGKYLWTNGVIPFRFTRELISDWGSAYTLKAMRIWEKYTCLKFRLAKPGEENMILFKNENGCDVHFGMTGGIREVDVGGRLCRASTGVMVHLLGHAIGLVDEAQRPDRDNYIDIDWARVKPSARDNLIKYSSKDVDTYGTTYDQRSIMHYGPKEFSSDGRSRTIYVKKSSGIKKMIMPILWWRFTLDDLTALNSMYNCDNPCTDHWGDARCKLRKRIGGCSGDFIRGNCARTCGLGLCAPKYPSWSV